MRVVDRLSCICVAVLSVVLLLFNGPSFAQTVNGSFRGTVTDTTGAAVPHATIKITNEGTGVSRETNTDTAGNYVLPEIPPGVYTVSASFTGFTTVENTGVTLLVNQVATLDFSLQPGTVKQQVTVAGQAAMVNLTNSTISTVVESKEVEQLPLNGRQFTQLMLLSPGVAPQSSGQQSFFEVHSDYGAISPAVNGTGPEYNNYTIDGVENNELFFNFPSINPPPDAIQEFNVQTDMSSGQYGRAGGANVNVVTRSGSNQIHGDAWEFLRNTSLDARNFFNPLVSVFHQNQFGGTVGGPVRRDKVWAFGWYEGFRKTLGSSSLLLIPTAAQIQGDLSGPLFAQIYNPYTTTYVGNDNQGNPVFSRQPFQNNQIPNGMLNSAAVAAAKLIFPTPNYNGGPTGPNFLDSEPVATNTDQFGARVDAALSEKTTLFGRFAWDNAKRLLPSGIPAEPTNQFQLGAQQVLGLTHTLSPTAVLALRAQFLRTSVKLLGDFPPTSFLESNGFLRDWPAQTGLRPVMPGLSIANMNGIPGVAQSLPGAPINNWEFSGTFTKTAKKHTLAVGGSIIHTWVLDNCTYASGTFDQLPTSDPANPTTTGAGLASFLLGLPSGATDLRGSAQMLLHGNYYAGFVDDTWKATNKLTVDLSLRYDYSSPFQEVNGHQAALDIAHSTAENTVWLDVSRNALTGEPANAKPGLVPPDRKDIGPRVGLAYRLPHDFAARAGYGIFYDFNQSNVQNQQTFMGQWPFGLPDIVPSGLNAPTVANLLPQQVLGVGVFPPFVPSAMPPTSPGFAIDPTYKRPSVQSWNFGIEKSLKGNWLVSVTYLGNKGTHIVTNPYLNIAPHASTQPYSQSEVRLPYFSPMMVVSDWGNTSYEALQLKAEKRFSKGVTVLASYTYSKFISFDDSANSSGTIQNGLDFMADRSVSSYDLPHNFVFSYVYALPFGEGGRFLNSQGRMSKYLLKGWQTTGILTLRSGFPFNITVPYDNANVGAGTERPTLIGQLLPSGFKQSVNEWFNTAALTVIPGTFGNLGRNALRSDGVERLDFGMFKQTQITESKSVEFRAEFFNFFNTPIFEAPVSSFGSSYFGQVLGAMDPRFVQFGLKLVF